MAVALANPAQGPASQQRPPSTSLQDPDLSAKAKLFRSRSGQAPKHDGRRPSTALASSSVSPEAGPSNALAKLGLGRWRRRTNSVTSSDAADLGRPLSLSQTTSEGASMLDRRGSASGFSIQSSSTAGTHAEQGTATTEWEDKAGRRPRRLSFKKAAPSAWARYLKRGSSQSGPHALPPSSSAPEDISAAPSSSGDSRQAKSTTETMEVIAADEPVFAITRDGPHQDGLGRSLAVSSGSGDVGYIDYSRRARAKSLDALGRIHITVTQEEFIEQLPQHRLERRAQSSSGHLAELSKRPATASANLTSTSLTRSTSERISVSNADRPSERPFKRPLGPPPAGGRRRRTSSTRSSDDERAARIRANLALAGSAVAGVPSPPSSIRSGSTQSSMSGCSPGTFGPQTRYVDDEAAAAAGSWERRHSGSSRPFPPSPSLDSTTGGPSASAAGTPPRPSRAKRQPSQSRAELIRRQIMETQSDTGHNRRSAARYGSKGGGGKGSLNGGSALRHDRRCSQGAERILESTGTAVVGGGLSPTAAAWEASAANAPPVSPSGWYNAAHGGASPGRPSSADAHISGRSITDLRREAASHWGGRAADPALIKMALAQSSPKGGNGGSFSSRVSLASSGGHGGKAQSLTSLQSGEGERQPVLPPRFGSREGPAMPRTHQRTSSLIRFVQQPASLNGGDLLGQDQGERGKKRGGGKSAEQKAREKALPPRPATSTGVLSQPLAPSWPTRPTRDPKLRVPVKYDGARESGSSGQSSTDDGSHGSSGGVPNAELEAGAPITKPPISPNLGAPPFLSYSQPPVTSAATAAEEKSAKKAGGLRRPVTADGGAEEGKRRRALRFLTRIIG